MNTVHRQQEGYLHAVSLISFSSFKVSSTRSASAAAAFLAVSISTAVASVPVVGIAATAIVSAVILAIHTTHGSRTLALLLGYDNLDLGSIKLGLVKSTTSGLGVVSIRVLDKSETSGPLGVVVQGKVNISNLTELAKGTLDIFGSRAEVQTANKNCVGFTTVVSAVASVLLSVVVAAFVSARLLVTSLRSRPRSGSASAIAPTTTLTSGSTAGTS